MAEPALLENERLDDLQLSGLKIIQNTTAFCFGMDAVLLSGFVKLKRGGRLLDMCTGNGILPLLLSAKTEAEHITGIEIQKEAALLAKRNVQLNDLDERIDIIEGDIKEAGRIFRPASFDAVSCNPPYIAGGGGLINPDDQKAVARHEIKLSFEDVCAAAAHVLKEGGKIFLVHRPERIAELLYKLGQKRLECKRLRFVYPYADKEPNMVLIEAVYGGNPGVKVEKPLIIYENDGEYTREIREDYGF